MDKVMAIMTKIHEVFNRIVFSIFINVMNRNDSGILRFTQSAGFFHSTTSQYATIRELSILVIGMIGSDVEFIPPQRLTTLAAKIFSAF